MTEKEEYELAQYIAALIVEGKTFEAHTLVKENDVDEVWIMEKLIRTGTQQDVERFQMMK
jgi:hypothetical protein